MSNLRVSRPRSLSLRVLAGLTLTAGVAVLAGSAAASPPTPPPEAFTACEGKARGDACTVQLRDRAINGVCDAPPGESRLACRPDGPPPPPPEAFTACDGKARGDACSVQIHDHTMNGVCDAPPGESRLACRPSGPPPEHR